MKKIIILIFLVVAVSTDTKKLERKPRNIPLFDTILELLFGHAFGGGRGGCQYWQKMPTYGSGSGHQQGGGHEFYYVGALTTVGNSTVVPVSTSPTGGNSTGRPTPILEPYISPATICLLIRDRYADLAALSNNGTANTNSTATG